jgi:hypothetical protein
MRPSKSTSAWLAAGLGGEPGKRGADVPWPELGALVDAPGEEAPAERAERHQPDVEFLQDAEDFLFGLTPEQRVLALQGRDRGYRVRPADGARSGLGQAEVPHLARRDQFPDRSGDLLDRHLRVHPVLVQQVNPPGAQPPQRPVHRLPNVIRPAGQPGLAALAVEGEAELGGDDYLVADRGERLADQFLVDERAVDLGGVEERDAQVDRGSQQVNHLAAVARVRAEALAHAHAAESESGNLQPAGPQDALFHVVPPRALVISKSDDEVSP